MLKPMCGLPLRSLRYWVVLLSLLPGCSSAKIGEECDDIGKSDECEDGALCTNEANGGICRAICTETIDCPAGHTCNGVSGTNVKSCQPDVSKK
jgi:hypothetical protein